MAMARPLPKRRPAPQHKVTRRHLRVIPGGKGAQRHARDPRPKKGQRTSVAFLIAVAVTIGALVFGLVLLNVYLAQSSFKLADLEQRVAQQEELYRMKRLQVATAESPDKIASAAANIGLVAPDQQEYIIGREQVKVAQVPPPKSQDQGIKAVLGARP